MKNQIYIVKEGMGLFREPLPLLRYIYVSDIFCMGLDVIGD